MSNIIIVEDDLDNHKATATAQVVDGPPILEPNVMLPNNNQTTEQDFNQITITIMDSGDVQIVNPDGKMYLIVKEILQQENIDTDNLNDDSIRLLLQMTSMPNRGLNQQGQSNLTTLASSYGSTVSTRASNGRKRRNKEIFDPTAIVKAAKLGRTIANTKNSAINAGTEHNLKFVPYQMENTPNTFSSSAPTNTSNGQHGIFSGHSQIFDLIKLRGSGAVIYKPEHQSSTTRNQNRHCCAYCQKNIPKSKLDFLLIRLPIHIDCNDSSADMSVLLDSDEVANKGKK